MTINRAALLAAYDDQLRAEVEMGGQPTTRIGPLYCTHRPTRGFLSYRDLAGLDGDALDELIERAIAHYRDETPVPWFEWKTRGHDTPTDLPQRLRAHGFEPEDVEAVMAGPVDGVIAAAAPLPAGVTIRQVAADDVTSISQAMAMQAHVFGRSFSTPEEESARMLATDGLTTLWVAEAADEAARGQTWGAVICAGKIDVAAGTDFAGVWGGSALEHWRGKGVYRALTAARAAHARELGARYLQSDSTPYSAPILERAGLTQITTTTPYIWRRNDER